MSIVDGTSAQPALTSTFTREAFNAFIAALPFPPNKFQLDVLESLAFGKGNIQVSALAGSGKTSLLVQAANLLKAMGEPSGLFMAFNKKIAEELNERLPQGFAATTSHSYGMKLLKKIQPKTSVDYKKWDNLCRAVADDLYYSRGEQYSSARTLKNLCSKVMLNKVDPNDEAKVLGLAFHYGMEDIDPKLVRAVPGVLKKALEAFQSTGSISFDEMIYLPVILGVELDKFRYVFGDETQDWNVLQQDLAIGSIAPDGRIVAVGDPAQSIYAFSGADAESFHNVARRTNARVLPLNVCYRCPSSHLDLARALVPQIEARPGAPEGEVVFAPAGDLYKLAQPGCLVMSRTKAPLVSVFFDLIAQRRKAIILGKDIGEKLAKTLDAVSKLEGFRYEATEFNQGIGHYLDWYERIQTHKLQERDNSEEAVEALRDEIECLQLCVQNFHECHDLDCLKAELEKLFTSEDDKGWRDMIALCTVHKAKGLEADETFIVNPDKMPLVWPNQKEYEAEQERNILYVALTRAKKRMTILGEEGSLKVKPVTWEEAQAQLAAQPITPVVEEVVEPTPAPQLRSPVPVEPQPAPKFQVTGDLKADWKAFQQLAAEPVDSPQGENPSPLSALKAAGETLVTDEPETPAPTPEITPVVVKTPQQRLDDLFASMSVDEIDTMIALLQTVRAAKAVENA